MTTPPWRVRPPRPQDESALIELFRQSFGREITAEHYRWKLRTRQSPVENVAVAVNAADRPVFHFGGIPCRCRLAGQDRWVMIGVDVMTDSAFRRQGVLTAVAGDLFGRWREAGVALVFGLLNQEWRSRRAALGWRHLFPLSWLVFPLAPERVLARRLRLPFLNRATWLGAWWRRRIGEAPPAGMKVRELTRAGPEIDGIGAAAGLAGRYGLIKDAQWVNWRYLDAPDAGFRVLLAERDGVPAGYVAFRLRHGAGVIAEVVTAPVDRAVFSALVHAAVARLAEAGATGVRALAVPRGVYDRGFRAAGFWRGWRRFPVYAVLLDPLLSESDIGDPSHWSLAGGDFDVV